ncbi:hypothetical protein [Verminephrobacter aporrectodeae]|uniref:hypothetical protein n=1 Tax=Verminephrobacter aporrectodeae TaxID=1110389 RepID=UPI0022375D27|nr:hypothetical protein [Verminephrobacter aporrectodeae]
MLKLKNQINRKTGDRRISVVYYPDNSEKKYDDIFIHSVDPSPASGMKDYFIQIPLSITSNMRARAVLRAEIESTISRKIGKPSFFYEEIAKNHARNEEISTEGIEIAQEKIAELMSEEEVYWGQMREEIKIDVEKAVAGFVQSISCR